MSYLSPIFWFSRIVEVMPTKPHILFLTSYAPSTERPRAYNILRGLARHFRVSLISQVRSARDREAVEQMRSHCDDVEAVELSRTRILFNCLLHLLTPTPIRAAYFFNPEMKRTIVRRLVADRYDLVHVEHMMAAHFAAGLSGVPRSFDTIDSIARLQGKILRNARNPLERLISLEELPKVRRYEPALCRRFNCVLTSTDVDREALGVPGVRVVPNGVDLEHYRPSDTAPERDTILFYGRLSYVANAEALRWFLREIFPRILAERPATRLLVVGPSPPGFVSDAASDNLIVAGRVPDVREYIRRARLVVVPVRFAVGTQNKILEPMAMGVPVVATSEAIAAMSAQDGRDLLVGDTSADFARGVARLMDDDELHALIARAGLEYVRTHHDWGPIVDDLAAHYSDMIARKQGDAGSKI